jgi:hypothetical protein
VGRTLGHRRGKIQLPYHLWAPFLFGPLLSLLYIGRIIAQSTSLATNPPPLANTDKVVAVPLLSNQELILSIVVLLFGVYVVTLQYRLLKDAQSGADESLRALTVTLIVVISLAMISSGYGKEQISPVLGLFGTIIGYLLGASKTGRPIRKGKVEEADSERGKDNH